MFLLWPPLLTAIQFIHFFIVNLLLCTTMRPMTIILYFLQPQEVYSALSRQYFRKWHLLAAMFLSYLHHPSLQRYCQSISLSLSYMLSLRSLIHIRIHILYATCICKSTCKCVHWVGKGGVSSIIVCTCVSISALVHGLSRLALSIANCAIGETDLHSAKQNKVPSPNWRNAIICDGYT